MAVACSKFEYLKEFSINRLFSKFSPSWPSRLLMVTRATSRHQYHLPGSQPPPPALSASKHRTSALGSSRLRQNVLELPSDGSGHLM